MITKLIQVNSHNMTRKILDCFKHDFVNATTGATTPHQGIQKETLSLQCGWMGIQPIPTQLNGQSLTTRPGI
jgi:hypothetical protein